MSRTHEVYPEKRYKDYLNLSKEDFARAAEPSWCLGCTLIHPMLWGLSVQLKQSQNQFNALSEGPGLNLQNGLLQIIADSNQDRWYSWFIPLQKCLRSKFTEIHRELLNLTCLQSHERNLDLFLFLSQQKLSVSLHGISTVVSLGATAANSITRLSS